MNVTVVGLGKLGAVLAAVLARAGHTVVGVDLSQAAVDAVNEGTAPVAEAGLQELMDELADGSLTATTDYAEAVPQSDLTMVVVPTPSGDAGPFKNDYVVQAVESIGRNVQRWHTVVVCSTVMPGSMDNVIAPALEGASGRVVGLGVGLCYSPEFIALGSVIRDMTNPDMVLVGARDPRSTGDLLGLLGSFVQGDPAVHELDFNEAELAKISVNTFVTMKISYANTIAELCEIIPGADASKVLAAIGADGRIGLKYLTSGASFGGPCFPRDNRAFAAFASALGVQAHLAEATDEVNRGIAARVALAAAGAHGVAILGLSYKPGTGVVEESMGLDVAHLLTSEGVEVRVHDPEARPSLPEGATQFDSVEETLEGATLVIVTTPWPIYSSVDFAGRRIIDAWGCTLPQPNRRVLGKWEGN